MLKVINSNELDFTLIYSHTVKVNIYPYLVNVLNEASSESYAN